MRKPFLIKPIAKNYLWGGRRLNDDFGFGFEGDCLAEAWVCSTHEDGLSTVPKYNCTLKEILETNPEWLGTHPLQITNGIPCLPVLIKLIDAKKDLSVQVHPDDDYAKTNENSLGKTELWYVLDSKDDSELIYGFNRDVDKCIIKKAIYDGDVEKLLNHVPISKGNVFYIEPGIVHAIGSGALVVEIQESSNVTYRLYDYNRLDADGQKRQLHVEKALDVMNVNASDSPRQPMRVLKYRNGCANELLARCKYFQVERMILNTEANRDLVSYQTQSNSFHALLCVDGCGTISYDGFMINFFKGDCIFVPAESVVLKLHGKMQILDVSC